MAEIGAILHLQIEAGGEAEFRHRRRHQREDLGIGNAEESHEGAPCDGGGASLHTGPQIPVAQAGECDARILANAQEAEARDGKDHVDVLLFVLEIVVRDLPRHSQCFGLGRARRQVDQIDDEALVLIRQKAGGQIEKKARHAGHDQGIGHYHYPGAIEDSFQAAMIPVPSRFEAGVEPGEETAQQSTTMLVMTTFDRLEQGGAQCRRQHQGDHDGKRHGGHDGDGELAIDHAGRAAEERHRQEHRRQHQADADQGAGDFLHRSQGRFARRQTFLAHDALDILHHHDGIIDQKTDHQHQCEQG